MSQVSAKYRPGRGQDGPIQESKHESFLSWRDGILGTAQVPGNLAHTPQLRRPPDLGPELPGWHRRVRTSRGDGLRVDQLLGAPLFGPHRHGQPGGDGYDAEHLYRVVWHLNAKSQSRGRGAKAPGGIQDLA